MSSLFSNFQHYTGNASWENVHASFFRNRGLEQVAISCLPRQKMGAVYEIDLKSLS